MELLRFMEEFGTEQQCKDHFKAQREKSGLCCKKCGQTKLYWLKKKEQWQCSDTTCSFRMSLKSGSAMEHSKVSYLHWYMAMAFMTFSKKGISACEMQRQLDIKCYETVWYLMLKIRKSMGSRDNMYQLTGEIELDEGFFEIATPAETKLKRGKGSQKQQNVAVIAESTPLEDIETGKTSRHFRFLKMKVVEGNAVKDINEVIADCITKTSIVFSDKATNYINITEHVEAHFTVKSTKESIKTDLKWVHIAISNAKRFFLGVYHKIHGKYLQHYLDEFTYKLNRRYFGQKLFDRLSIAITKNHW
jgi:hypothetical protein